MLPDSNHHSSRNFVQSSDDSIPPALILFAHGARSQRWAAPFLRLQQLAQARMPEVNVHLAYLELMEPKLPDTVAKLALLGCTQVTIVPVFLGQGAHVLHDLPLMIEQLQFDHPEVNIAVAKAVGEDTNVLNAIAAYCVSTVGNVPNEPPL